MVAQLMDIKRSSEMAKEEAATLVPAGPRVFRPWLLLHHHPRSCSSPQASRSRLHTRPHQGTSVHPTPQGPGISLAATALGFGGPGCLGTCVAWGRASLPNASLPQPSPTSRLGPKPSPLCQSRDRWLGELVRFLQPDPDHHRFPPRHWASPPQWLGSGQEVSSASPPPPTKATCLHLSP